MQRKESSIVVYRQFVGEQAVGHQHIHAMSMQRDLCEPFALRHVQSRLHIWILHTTSKHPYKSKELDNTLWEGDQL